MLEDDVDFIRNSIEETQDYTDEFITIFTVSSSTGTASSLEPRSVTWGSTETRAKVRRLSAREVNESGGIYKMDDLLLYTGGSLSSDAKVGYRTGTYEVVDSGGRLVQGTPIHIGGYDVRFQTAVRRA